MDIHDDTASFEAWLRTQCEVFEPALERKHDEMKKKYPFFRATYYRWARHWRTICPDLQDAPSVLALGDIHLENYGTWRDGDCRLSWGVNEFDEADDLPYAHDLVRLAASTQFAKKIGKPKLDDVCEVVLSGYRDCLEAEGDPFVLEEDHHHLRKLALRSDQVPHKFWKKKLNDDDTGDARITIEARSILEQVLPELEREPILRPSMFAGVGSLGKPRFAAFAKWHGGWICREAKAMTPPATAWLDGSRTGSRLAEIVEVAVRSPDPFYRPIGGWITRRLAPHCSRIELNHMTDIDVLGMLDSMGRAIANVHLGTAGAADVIGNDLKHRRGNWLEFAAAAMSEAIERDWKRWKKHPQA